MKIVTSSAARTRLRELLDECELTNEPICINSIKNQMIVISKAQYDTMINKIKGDSC